MTTRSLKIAFWPIFAATIGVCASMLVWSLPAITRAANGAAPFDLRPFGYSFEDATAFLAALPPETVTFYRDIQIGMLDLAYPGLLAVTLFLAIGLLAPENWGYWRWVLALVSIPGTVFDYLENNMIRSMLLLGPDSITPEIVGRASEFTLRKAQFTTAAMIIVLILLALWISRSILSSKLSRRSRSSS